ncbi:hypothetical protein TNCT_378241 [Trichonephila clavata]|uniref:Uncharacterized protein n=1 Tax=Trichonephila clavata TaxID=2740835 RepID=A0A8X6J1K4_TRICU|nr:hypothetical protein TNCT_378241 [Trichonephila clavata]
MCVPLTQFHKICHFWGLEQLSWIEKYRSCVLFSDESQFSILSDSRRVFNLEELGKRYRINSFGILAWRGTTFFVSALILIFSAGAVTVKR